MISYQLQPWQELIGIFQNLTIDDDVVIATISGYMLRYPSHSQEGAFLIKHLTNDKLGEKVEILNAESDLRILWPNERQSTEPSRFWKWYCKTYGIPEEW